jgi:5-formyltetrahydrofolate cyclo-ligase
MSNISHSKQALRRHLRKQCLALSEGERSKYSTDLCKTLTARPEFIRSRSLGVYWPQGGEISPERIIQKAFKMRKLVFLPVLHPVGHKRLLFVQYTGDTLFKTNAYGILEPRLLGTSKIVPAWTLDLVLLPLVAFDNQGQRLGRGGGYYDRTFSFMQKKSKPRTPHLVGLAYEFQNVDILPVDNWDIPLTGIATENRFIIV